jgi:hypothetical protein
MRAALLGTVENNGHQGSPEKAGAMTHDLVIELSPGEGVSGSRFDRLCGDIADEVRRVKGLSVSSPRIEGTPGTKSGLVHQIGVLAVSGLLSAAGLRAIADIVIARTQRSTVGAVTFRRGDVEVTMSGIHPDDVPAETAKLVEAFKEDQ